MKPGLVISLLLVIAVKRMSADSPADRLFLDKVKPLLDSRCVSCHGSEKQKGSLRLDSRQAALKGGDTGPAIVPGKPAQSLLVQAVMHTKSDLGMPPKEKLTTNDIALLERWIKDGAIWPAGATIASMPKLAPGERLGNAWNDARNPIVRIFGGQRLDLWSLKAVQKPLLPAVRQTAWVRSPIDRFVLAKLEQSGLQPAPEADRRALARRLYFDLIGLPPSAEEMDRFLGDKSPQSYERLVDRLLDSPKYGEHSARQWLDVIRYSDSNGFDWDEYRPKAWRFRDYVIRSFNSDKPFDQFIREQLAGDEMLNGPPQNAREQDCLIATGYLRLGPQDNSAGLFNEQARARAELMSDLTETTASAFLGMTMGCCRCHDHKYDPLSQADHYRMRAFFEAVKYADDTPLDLAVEQELIKKNNAKLDAEIEPLKKQRDGITAAVKKRLQEELQAKLTIEEKALLDTPKDKRTDEIKTRVAAVEKKLEVKDKDVLAALGKEQKKQYDDFGKEIAALRKKQMSLTTGLLMTDSNEKAPVTRILFQGDHKQERDLVDPGFISALDPNPAAIRKAMNPKTTGRRLTLAEWIASPENPLTARVFVNRVWQGHFGKGLVSTANDFGLAGSRPTHPELLDWLAQEFMREGWSIKKLHRLVVLSATYRQASSAASKESRGIIFAGKGQFWRGTPSKNPNKIDSENNLLWRQNLRRLSAEQLRDALLAISGSLNERAGGPPAWPTLPPEVLQEPCISGR